MGVRDDEALWIRRFHPGQPGAVQLVCLPHAGGSASFYCPLSRALCPQVEVLVVQYPGRLDRRAEQPERDLRVLARRTYQALRGRTDRPIALFGHSMGATLGYEIALLMQREGIPVRHLFASGRRAPSRHREETVHLGSDDTLIAELRALDGTSGAMLTDGEVLRMILPALRADYTAAETYLPQDEPKLSCPITVFAGDADPKVTVDEAKAWDGHTDADFDIRLYPGGHFFLVNHQRAMTEAIAAALQ